MHITPSNLVGIGLYTPSEASRLTGVPVATIRRWLRGHAIAGCSYEPLWPPQIALSDGSFALGFRDLMEIRAAFAFTREAGLSPQKLRRAIQLARELIGDNHPLSTFRFRTDGKTVFLQIGREEGDDHLIDIFKRQYALKRILDPALKYTEYDSGVPARWWPLSQRSGIVVDPQRSFGKPIDSVTGIPTQVLAAAAIAEGSVKAAAKAYLVPVQSVERAIQFEQKMAA